ncbi:Small ubiquitin-related modifier 3 [Oopsacas minuta]|uniref:Small ubiquitin-related modifier n=1 Tax=Oopsacas minuta TaxID=111878 RepID=A0AAV7K898_9METZ|nr:Small ubiquitin-related modifier 3 [Oopsacas minuta]
MAAENKQDPANSEMKSEPSSEDSHLNLKVMAQDGSVVQFKIKRRTPLKKLMTAYCDRMGKQLNSLRFVFDGNRINEDDNPSTLEMTDDDQIEVFQDQIGGGLIEI